MLLLAACFVQLHDKIRFFCIEVGWWIVERHVPILPDAGKDHVNGSASKLGSDLSTRGGRIRFAIEQPDDVDVNEIVIRPTATL